MKNRLVVVLAIVFVLMITGCGNSNNAEESNGADSQTVDNTNQTDTDTISPLDGVTMEEVEYSDAEASMTSQKDISVASVWDRERVVKLSAEDAALFVELMESGSWMEGTGDCSNDCIIFMNEEDIKYHSDCGTFNDTVNEKRLHLTEEQQAEVNAVLEKHIKLGSE